MASKAKWNIRLHSAAFSIENEPMTQSLCESCQNVREVRTARSRFLLCELSVTNDDYPKYPPQPIVRCDGYKPKDKTPEEKA